MAEELIENVVTIRGHRTWTGTAGGGQTGVPLLVIHGGPAIPHDCLLPLADLAARGRPVVFYDQLGCGRSDRPDDPSLRTIDAFVEEIALVREALGLDHVALFAHSLGGIIALRYLLDRPEGVSRVVLASAVPSVPQYVTTALAQLEGDVPGATATVHAHESAGTTDDPAYSELLRDWSGRRMLRFPLDAWPDEVNRAFEGMGYPVYQQLWGGPQFRPGGELADIDLLPRLGELDVPTLVINGEHDYITPQVGAELAAAIPGAQLVTVPGASHMGWWENPAVYLTSLGEFLDHDRKLVGAQ